MVPYRHVCEVLWRFGQPEGGQQNTTTCTDSNTKTASRPRRLQTHKTIVHDWPLYDMYVLTTRHSGGAQASRGLFASRRCDGRASVPEHIVGAGLQRMCLRVAQPREGPRVLYGACITIERTCRVWRAVRESPARIAVVFV